MTAQEAIAKARDITRGSNCFFGYPEKRVETEQSNNAHKTDFCVQRKLDATQ